jgi:hypothetical protein
LKGKKMINDRRTLVLDVLALLDTSGMDPNDKYCYRFKPQFREESVAIIRKLKSRCFGENVYIACLAYNRDHAFIAFAWLCALNVFELLSIQEQNFVFLDREQRSFKLDLLKIGSESAMSEVGVMQFVSGSRYTLGWQVKTNLDDDDLGGGQVPYRGFRHHVMTLARGELPLKDGEFAGWKELSEHLLENISS